MIGVIVACWAIVLIRCWWPGLTALGKLAGRGTAWLCTGQPGIAIGRAAIERARCADLMRAHLDDAASWRYSRPASHGLWQATRGPLPGERWQRGVGWQPQHARPVHPASCCCAACIDAATW